MLQITPYAWTWRSGKVQLLGVVAMLAVALAAIGLSLSREAPVAGAEESKDDPLMSLGEHQLDTIRGLQKHLRLEPAVLAALGLDADQAEQVLRTLADWTLANADALARERAQERELRRALGAALRSQALGTPGSLGSPSIADLQAAAKQQKDAATARRDAAVTAVNAAMPPEAATLWANARAHPRVPLPYCLLDNLSREQQSAAKRLAMTGLTGGGALSDPDTVSLSTTQLSEADEIRTRADRALGSLHGNTLVSRVSYDLALTKLGESSERSD